MRKVRSEGVRAARHIEKIKNTNKHLYEVRREHRDLTYRILFVPVGKNKNIFLALSGFKKKTRKTPRGEIATAIERLEGWEERGRAS